ncbi:MAG: DUF5069 domain-containing protein [Candidatus Eremiobacteraeota bacterium]|nr:DUF5069 domain-containing protein [Candidatus Eremiobacteraeota bacterium]
MTTSAQPWVPRSPFERLENCVFLGRVIDKARRHVSGLPIGEYMYGDNDYMDSRVFKVLNCKASEVDALVRAEPSDAVVARTLVERSGRSPGQIAAFSTKMVLIYGPVFFMFDADEGRKTGPIAAGLSAFYNRVMYPPFAEKFRKDEDAVGR